MEFCPIFEVAFLCAPVITLNLTLRSALIKPYVEANFLEWYDLALMFIMLNMLLLQLCVRQFETEIL